MAKAEKGFIKRLMDTFEGLNECEEVEIKDSYHLGSKKIRVTNRDYPLQINLGPKGKELHIYPEPIIITEEEKRVFKFYIIFDPDTYYNDVAGFIRLDEGETLLLSRDDPLQKAFFAIPSYISSRHLSISQHNGGVELKNHATDLGSCVAPLIKEKKANRILKLRFRRLERLKEIFGGKIELQTPADALSLIQAVNAVMEREVHRPLNLEQKPGGVVELAKQRKRVIIIGDLHAKLDNLLAILSQNHHLEALESGDGVVVILGDAVHPEEEGLYGEMESSMLMMDFIFKLKLAFPKQLYYLRGNHDSFDDDFAKGGVPQGIVWEKTLKQCRGDEYLQEMKTYYQRLPYLAYNKRVIISHAAPPTSTVTLEDLINIEQGSKLCTELNRTRLYTSSRGTGYKQGDVKRLRKTLGVDKDAALVVGHTPYSAEDTIWTNIGGIDNHHVVFSSGQDWVGTITLIEDTAYPFRYHAEPLTEVINRIE
ncbi:MAG: metallophosphoesterase [Gammaproteobacteria bacterium]|nr:metallophosphoesterase [Gammaproteobacteria bacterium]